MEEYQQLLDMELHETLHPQNPLQNIRVMRVPGGWIYTIYISNSSSSVFVPFCVEKF